MAHDVNFSVPKRPLGRADVEFQVKRDGSMCGTLRISKGTLVWLPSNTTYGYRLGWKKFDQLMQDNATSFEPR